MSQKAVEALLQPLFVTVKQLFYRPFTCYNARMEFKHLFSPSGWINEFSRMAQYKNLNKGQGFLNKAVGPSLIRNAPLVESASKGLIQTGLESKGAGN